MEKHIIYRHTFPNGKFYVGQCQGETIEDANKRWGKNGCKYKGQFVYRAIKKYGWENIQHEIIEVVDNRDAANDREIYYIALYDSTDKSKGYNIQSGGEGNNMGKNSYTKEYVKKSYYEHHVERLETSRRYREGHREERRQYSREYYEEHKEERRQYCKDYNKVKGKELNEKRRRKFEEDPKKHEKYLEYLKQYRESHREELRQAAREYARKKRMKNDD